MRYVGLVATLLVVVAAGGGITGVDSTQVRTAASPTQNSTASSTQASTTGSLAITAVVPNPVAAEDRGEYLRLSIPNGTDLSAVSITDDEATVTFPNRTVSGTVAVSTTPAVVETNLPILSLRGDLALANSGETIRLSRANRTIDTVRYEDAPEGEAYVETASGWTWRPIGTTDRPVVRAENATVRSFVLPDSPKRPVAPIRGATERLLLAGYTITGARVVRALCAAHDRGVRVRTLFEGGPVGGITRRMARRLDRLVACGVPVSVIGGDVARYSFHHAKYAVVDDRAVVLTENWKPSGTGGRSSRGWGTVVSDPRIASALAETFRADFGFRDAIPWERYRSNTSFVASPPAPTERYPTSFEPRRATATEVALLAAPDNAESTIVSRIDAAAESIRVEQISIGSHGHPFVRALLRAARRGVQVRVLLGSSSYVRTDNRRIAEWLNARARTEGLPLRARLATPRSRFEKIHAKGLVIDDTAVLGSINWTNESIRRNREIAVAITDAVVAGYYRRVFRADWRGGVWSLSAGLLALAALAVTGAVLVGSRMAFDAGGQVSPDAAVAPSRSERP